MSVSQFQPAFLSLLFPSAYDRRWRDEARGREGGEGKGGRRGEGREARLTEVNESEVLALGSEDFLNLRGAVPCRAEGGGGGLDRLDLSVSAPSRHLAIEKRR